MNRLRKWIYHSNGFPEEQHKDSVNIFLCNTVYMCKEFKVLYFLSCWSNAPLSWWKRTEMHSSHPHSLPAFIYSCFPMRNHVCNFNESSNIWSWLFTCDVFLYLCIYKGVWTTWAISNEEWLWKHVCCVIFSHFTMTSNWISCDLGQSRFWFWSSLTSKCAMGLLISIQVFNTNTINNPQTTIVFNEEHSVLQTLCWSAVEKHWPSRPTQLEKTDLPLTLKHHSGFISVLLHMHSSGSVNTQFSNRNDTASHTPDHSWRIQCVYIRSSARLRNRGMCLSLS